MPQFIDAHLSDCLESLPEDHPLCFLVSHIDAVHYFKGLDTLSFEGKVCIAQLSEAIKAYKKQWVEMRMAQDHQTTISNIATLWDDGHKRAAKSLVEYYGLDPDTDLVKNGLDELTDQETRKVIEKYARKLIKEDEG